MFVFPFVEVRHRRYRRRRCRPGQSPCLDQNYRAAEQTGDAFFLGRSPFPLTVPTEGPELLKGQIRTPQYSSTTHNLLTNLLGECTCKRPNVLLSIFPPPPHGVKQMQLQEETVILFPPGSSACVSGLGPTCEGSPTDQKVERFDPRFLQSPWERNSAPICPGRLCRHRMNVC